jgi:uroporphyrinogen-III synthase
MAIKKKKSTKTISATPKAAKVKKASVAKASKKAIKKTAVKKVASKTTATKKVIIKKNAQSAASKKATARQSKLSKVAAKKVVAKKALKTPAKKAVSGSSQSRSSAKKVSRTAAKAETARKVSEKRTAPVVAKKDVAADKVAKPKASSPVSTSTEKFVKIGVKTKKQLVAVAPQPVIEVSNHPKTRVKTILISQPRPESDKNPYYELAKKHNLIETFRQFIKIEGLPVKDFRAQRIDILEHKAVILTSRMAVDHYFRMCNEMRVTVPESMKYFCINEATAYYLQKYIQYRKRKIFFGHQTIQDLVDVIRKNREEKFLLPAADVHREQICDFLDAIDIKYTKAVMYRTVSADLSDIKNLNEYDMLVFFTPAGINSLKFNFPNFKQGNTRIACFGAATANSLKKHNYRLDVYAPNPKNPSMTGALDEYIKEANKR